MKVFSALVATSCLAVGVPLASAAADTMSCDDTYVLASESETEWTITCGSAKKPLVTFDPALLEFFSLGGESGLTMEPATAPQPTKITFPLDGEVEVKALKSSTVKKIAMNGSPYSSDVRTKPLVVSADSFTGLTQLEELEIGYTNVTGPSTAWSIPGTLNTFKLDEIGIEDFDVEVEGGKLNITTLFLFSLKGITEIPAVVFNAPLEFLGFGASDFPALTLSRKRYDRLIALNARFDAESYIGDCEGGKKETAPFSIDPILVCVLPTGEDDDLVYVETPSPSPEPTPENDKPDDEMSEQDKKDLEKLLEEAGKSDARSVRTVLTASATIALSLAVALAAL